MQQPAEDALRLDEHDPAGRDGAGFWFLSAPDPNRALLVAAGGCEYAIPITSVREVLPSAPAARLPGAPAWVLGLANVRGRIVTVVDLAAWLGRGSVEPGADARIVVIEHAGRRLGIAVAAAARIVTGAAAAEARAAPIDPAELLASAFA